MIYLTYNDAPGGIYNSQVIDVVKYLDAIQTKERLKLVALISIRGFSINKKKIKAQLPQSIVIPMFPKAGLWRWNIMQLFFMCLFSSHKQIIARGAFATNLGLTLKKIGLIKRVVFDARGAYYAELTEYKVIDDSKVISQIKDIENKAIHQSDYKLAVTEALVDYWKKNYNYQSKNHVIIPCTLSANFIFEFPSLEELKNLKQKNNFSVEDIILVYSGSSAGWQSFDLLEEWLLTAFEKNANLKLVMLTNHPPEKSGFFEKHKYRIFTKWLQPNEVKDMLLLADYGLMYRENTVTNQVASPVKFAEYLSCGLQIITSDNLGDFSDFVKTNNCGFVLPAQIDFKQIDYSIKKQNHTLAMQFLIKENYKKNYLKLLACE
ncbi:MAG: hypothetical protein SFY56_00680 [Bacteroidota bacterium]|nr:hypothetical protein [Bacteroidota bacterium]